MSNEYSYLMQPILACLYFGYLMFIRKVLVFKNSMNLKMNIKTLIIHW